MKTIRNWEVWNGNDDEDDDTGNINDNPGLSLHTTRKNTKYFNIVKRKCIENSQQYFHRPHGDCDDVNDDISVNNCDVSNRNKFNFLNFTTTSTTAATKKSSRIKLSSGSASAIKMLLIVSLYLFFLQCEVVLGSAFNTNNNNTITNKLNNLNINNINTNINKFNTRLINKSISVLNNNKNKYDDDNDFNYQLSDSLLHDNENISNVINKKPNFNRYYKPTIIYQNEFAVHIPEGLDVANSIADKYGFINMGQVIYFHFYIYKTCRFISMNVIAFGL